MDIKEDKNTMSNKLDNRIQEDKPKPKTNLSNLEFTFKQNRSFELRVGRETFYFEGRVTLPIPRWVLTHKDFTPAIKNLFTIKGA